MAENDLLVHTETDDATAAEIVIDTNNRADYEISPYLFAKFCEHLGNNIYHGMESQILFNPVFGEWHFRGSDIPSGGNGPTHDIEDIREKAEAHDRPLAYPESTDTDALLAAYQDALAFGWLPTCDEVTTSPDTGPNGNRAQRIETDEEREGIEQRTHLPLHRVNNYEFRCKIRSTEASTGHVIISTDNGIELSDTTLDVTTEWTTIEGEIELPADIDPDEVYRIALIADDSAEFVIERLLLYPADHVDYADPEIIEYLRESDLTALRWPGGNFVSGYHWRDGIGPVDERPTKPNPNWEGLEYNLFGTDEFMQFCENVGCEPTICVNAGNGTPEEAAKWVEYCNGDPEETEMGALRAQNGHPEPYDVTYWEIGNELWGEWQVRWTTATGNVDRYKRFREAMLEVDPDIKLTATGLETNDDPEMGPLTTNGHWNDILIERASDELRAISDHVLAGGQVDRDTDPRELFRAYMGFSEKFGSVFRDLEDQMLEAGIEDPRFDLTELQIFASISDEESGNEVQDDDKESVNESEVDQLNGKTLPTPITISEALYNASIRNEMIRMGEFAEMLTHSATVNHGGGLQKSDERVWADPCHYGRSLTTALAGDIPVSVEIACDTISTTQAFREIDPIEDVPAVDVMATEGDDVFRVILVNRTSHEEPIDVSVDFSKANTGNKAKVAILSAETWYEQNSRDEPEHVTPVYGSTDVENNTLEVTLDPYSMIRLTVPKSEP